MIDDAPFRGVKGDLYIYKYLESSVRFKSGITAFPTIPRLAGKTPRATESLAGKIQ